MANQTQEEIHKAYEESLSPKDKELYLAGKKKSMEDFIAALPKTPSFDSDPLAELQKPQAPAPLVHDNSGSPPITTDITTTSDGNTTQTNVGTPDVLPADPLMGPDNFPVGGKLSDMGEGTPQGVFSTPRAGSRVWIFFHGGDIQRPVYFAQSIPPTEYQNFYGNPEPQSGENNDSLPSNVIDTTTGKVDPIPNTTDNTQQPTPTTNKDALQPYTGNLQEQNKQAHDAAMKELNALKPEAPTSEAPTSQATGWNQVKTDRETGKPKYTIN